VPISLHPIEPQRLYRQIAEQLRTLITAEKLAVGSRLPAERDLARQLGVSRPSVREALIAMEVEGWVEVRTGSGVYVLDRARQASGRNAGRTPKLSPDEWGPLELMRARELVEGEVAALAARNARKADLHNIEAALRQMQDEVAAGREPRQGDEAFHNAIAQACGNEVLRDTVRGYWQARYSPLFERLGDHFENPPSWKAAMAEHAGVLDAIRSRDATAARQAMQHHLKKARDRYTVSWNRAKKNDS
jgi:DNA-binding FadR family transcriptional regulator